MKTILRLVQLFLLLILIWGCGGSSSSVSGGGISVTVIPGNVTLAPNEKLTFGATVTGTTNTAVTWQASGGSIDSNGNYTAGAAIGSFTVTAISVANPNATGGAAITISNSTGGVIVTVHPSQPTVTIGKQQQFTATVTGVADTSVTWFATGGTIDQTGLFTAPNIPGNIVVTARSNGNPNRSGTTIVSVVGTGIRVSVTPNPVTMPTHGTQTFTANVTGTSNTAVTWSATAGTIDANGNYQAPEAGGNYNVTATSAADPTAQGVAAVTVQVVSVSVTPPAVGILFGQQQQFKATVGNTSQNTVTWTATGGTVDTTGLYTAPSVAGTYTVTATSTFDALKKGSATVVVFNPLFYSNNFSGTVGSEWSKTATDKTPSGRSFLGQFGTTDAPVLSLSGMPLHSTITVAFQLFVIRGWQGDAPTNPDLWTLMADSAQLNHTTFSNTTGDLQAFPLDYPTGSEANPGTGASELGTLGYVKTAGLAQADAVYSFVKTFPHSNSTLALSFAGQLNGTVGSESWGIANISVTLNP